MRYTSPPACCVQWTPPPCQGTILTGGKPFVTSSPLWLQNKVQTTCRPFSERCWPAAVKVFSHLLRLFLKGSANLEKHWPAAWCRIQDSDTCRKISCSAVEPNLSAFMLMYVLIRRRGGIQTRGTTWWRQCFSRKTHRTALSRLVCHRTLLKGRGRLRCQALRP